MLEHKDKCAAGSHAADQDSQEKLLMQIKVHLVKNGYQERYVCLISRYQNKGQQQTDIGQGWKFIPGIFDGAIII